MGAAGKSGAWEWWRGSCSGAVAAVAEECAATTAAAALTDGCSGGGGGGGDQFVFGRQASHLVWDGCMHLL